MGPIKLAKQRTDDSKLRGKASFKEKVKRRCEKEEAKTNVSKSHMANTRGLTLKKVHGQHLLRNPGIVDKIVRGCQIQGSDTVVEIGPGTGNLTMKLLPACKKVVAVDVDARMIAEVRKRAYVSGFQNMEGIHCDALKFVLPDHNVFVSNTPYQISSPLLFKIVAHSKTHPNFRRAVLMFQKEFALRLMCQPGQKHFCRLSVNAQIWFKVEKICDVGRNNFNPPPKVDSMVVSLVPRRDPNLESVDFPQWDAMLRILFSRKNRTIRSQMVGNKTMLGSLFDIHNRVAPALGRCPKTPQEFKDLVELTLDKKKGRGTERASKMRQEDFLELLADCMDAGIVFSEGGQYSEAFDVDDEEE